MRIVGGLAAVVIAAGLSGGASGETPGSIAYSLVEGSTIQRGCFEPCACPIGQEQPLTGTFSLVPVSDNGLFAEYKMADVKWRVRGSGYATPADAAITGSGTYAVGGEVAVQQQMTADLTVANEPPTRFDSGRVAGAGGFPDRIDIEISKNGKVCLDTVIHVVAVAQPTGRVCGGIAGIQCAAGEFCKYEIGDCCCDFQGVCMTAPDGCLAIWDPVCGCDGKTYSNECEADRAGAPIAHRGECCDPARGCTSDADGDGLPDASDDCPHRWNPGQEDSGGIDTSAPDGIGNACQCGDLTGNGVVNLQDARVARRHGLGLSSPLFAEPGNCDVTGNGRCDGLDGRQIKRAVMGLPSTVPAQKCPNANPSAPICESCAP